MSEAATAKPKTIKPRRMANSPRFVLYTAVLSTVMMLILYIALGIWPFGGGTVLTGDLNSQYINYFSFYKNAVLENSSLVYSFTKGLGGGLIGLFAYYVSSPFNLLYLITPLKFFPVTASIIWLLKTVLACCFAQIWLGQRRPAISWWSVALALCYGFMSYNFAYAQNIMWMDGVLILPLLCLGVERIAAGKPFTLYAVSLAVAIFSNFYVAYMMCLFLVLYFFYTMAIRKSSVAKPAGWKTPVIRFAAGSLLAGGINAALLMPSVMSAQQSKGGLLDFTFSFQPLFSLRRLPERFVFASFAQSDMEGHLPFIYCGALVLILALTYFVNRGIPLKNKLLSAGMVIFFVLSFWISGLDTIWHGFKPPVWFPARYSFIFSAFLVLLAADALSRRKYLIHDLPVAGGIIIVLLFFMAAFPVGVSRSRILLTVIITAAITIGCTAWLKHSSLRRVLFQALIFTIVAAELVGGAFYMQARFEKYPLQGFQNVVENEGGAVQAIKQQDDASYRIAATGFRSLNDAMLLDYMGIGHFSSVQDGSALDILYNLGYRVYSGNGPYVNGNTAFADSVLGIKYLYNNSGKAIPPHWSNAGIDAPLPVYKNNNAFPFAFTVNTETEQDIDLTQSPEELGEIFNFQNEMYRALGGEGNLFFSPSRIVLRANNGEGLSLSAAVPPGAAYEITAKSNGWHYVYFSAEGAQEENMWVNGVQAEPYFTSLNNGIINLGWLAGGQTATVYWSNSQNLQINTISAAGLDEKKLSDLSQLANQNSGSFTLGDGIFNGTFTAGENSFLYTSIPFDEGWQATVNGQPVQPEVFMGGLLALPLSPGENTVVLEYILPGTGDVWKWISIISAALLVMCIILRQLAAHGKITLPAFSKKTQAKTETAQIDTSTTKE